MPECINFLKLWALCFVNGILLNLPGEELFDCTCLIYFLDSFMYLTKAEKHKPYKHASMWIIQINSWDKSKQYRWLESSFIEK